MPGVYIYKDTAGEVLYVGKAKNLNRRVKSYFRPPIRLEPKTASLVGKIASIEYIEVFSETESLLLEAKLIKKFRPFFNLAGKDDKSPYYIHLTREKFPRPVLSHDPEGAAAGPFLNSLIPKRILRHFRHIAPYCSAVRPVKRPCFYAHIGMCASCPGNAPGVPNPAYRQIISRLKSLLSGNFKQVRSKLEREMLHAAKSQDYEQAGKLRDYQVALDALLAIPVSPDEYLVNPNLVSDRQQLAVTSLASALSPYFSLSESPRIEMYDVAHLHGDSATAAMTVSVNGRIDSKNFRHFTIKLSRGDSDVDSMQEVVSRRLARSDWPQPDLIVLDGGVPQLGKILDLSSQFKLPPVIALAKRLETLVIPTPDGFTEINLDRSHPGLLLLQHLRDEAHRFSRRLHHKHRRASFLTSKASRT